MSSQKAIYIGAGIDIVPVLLFDTIDEYIYIDSQPFSEFGTQTYIIKTNTAKHVSRDERFFNDFSRGNFMENLINVMKQNYFRMVEKNDDFLLFKNDKKTIKYYYSCAFPEHITEEMKDELKDCNVLILIGHDPHKNILKYIKLPTTIIASDNTVYRSPLEEDDDYEKSTFKTLNENKNLIKEGYLFKMVKDYDYWDPKHKLPSIKNNYKIINISELPLI
jgi:hypothetical protein